MVKLVKIEVHKSENIGLKTYLLNKQKLTNDLEVAANVHALKILRQECNIFSPMHI